MLDPVHDDDLAVVVKHLAGVVPTASTVRGALHELEAARLATRQVAEDGTARWSATDPPHCDAPGDLKLRGPHDLRHTFSTWLEDAGIPPRVIDEVPATWPLRGSGADRPSGALRAIASSARPRLGPAFGGSLSLTWSPRMEYA